MLSKHLHLLKNTGEAGFEGLIRRLLIDLSGLEFRLSRAGSQYGRDARAQASEGSVAFECKNYRKVDFDERELIAELDQAIGDDPQLDIWILAASRVIPDQLSTQLTKKAGGENVDFIGLDCCESGQPGSLDCLCAAFPGELLNALSDQKIDAAIISDAERAMTEIAKTAGFAKRIENIRKKVTEPALGWPTWRGGSANIFLGALASENSSRARFGQLLHILSPNAHAVLRRDASAALDHWWANWTKQNNIFFMLGEEGDGKTWSVAQWLASRVQSDMQFPPVVFISSMDAVGKGNLEELVVSRLEEDFGRVNWKERLNRWRRHSASHGSIPLAIVVLDGLNERQSAEFWRSTIDTGLAETWKEAVALICTARTGYWNEFFKPLRYLRPLIHTIKPYDDAELTQALSSRNQDLTGYPDALHPVLRKPRYLDLAVTYRERLQACGDFTVARLIYEDWRDRYERKNSCPMSEQKFNDLLTGFGNDFLTGQKQWDPDEIAHRLALTDNRVAAFQELSTGGIIHKSGGSFAVQPGPLAMGLGMLLCDQLEKAEDDGENLQESIALWIEPHAGVELQSQVLELAALHSLMKDHSGSIRIALLDAWLGTQNPTTVLEESVIRRFTAYLPDNTETYFGLAEKVWSTGCNNPWAQEILLRGFINWAHHPNQVLKNLPIRLMRWLGMIPVKGYPAVRQGDKAEENLPQIRNQLIASFGTADISKTVNLAGHSFVLIDDDGLLRLARVALAIISTFDDRTQFIAPIVTAMLSDSVFDGDLNYPEKMDLLRWLMRSSTVDLSDTLLAVAKPLFNETSPICKRAATRLYTSIGTKSGWHQWETMDQEAVFPTPEWVKKEQQNPFESLFTVSTAVLEEYPTRQDFKPWNFLLKIGNRVTQRTFDPQGDMAALLHPVFNRFDGKSLWTESGLSAEEHILDQDGAVLARYCCSDYCDLIRFNLTKAMERSLTDAHGERTTAHLNALLRVRFEFNKYDLLLRQADREMINEAWKLNRHALLNSDSDHQYTESLMFQTILPVWDGQQQLTKLLERDDAGCDLASYIHTFGQSTTLTFNEPQSPRNWTRLCIFLSSIGLSLLDEQQVQRCMVSMDANVRSAVLRYLYSSKDSAASVESLLFCNWRWLPNMTFVEQEYGAAILIKHGQQTDTDNLLDRVPPTRRGTAVVHRGADTHNIAEYMNWIDTALTAMIDFEMPSDYPSIEIEYYDELPASPYPVSVNHDEESRSIRFVSPESIWGGRLSTRIPDFQQDHDKTRAIWKSRYDRLEQVTEEGAASGNHWVSNVFHTDGLKDGILADPGLVARWIGRATSSEILFRARSFFQALCEVLFQIPSHHSDAVALYRALTSESRLMHVMAAELNIPQIDISMFASNSTAEVEKLWNEKLVAAASDKDLLNLAIGLRHTANSQAGDWFRSRIQADIQSSIPFLTARAYCLLGFFEIDEQAAWLSKNIPTETYWLEDVQRIAQERFRNEADCRFWFSKFCTQANLDEAWSSFQLFLACVDRRCWLWIESDIEKYQLTADKRRFLKLNRQAIAGACEKNEKVLNEKFLDCKIDLNLRPWLRFSS